MAVAVSEGSCARARRALSFVLADVSRGVAVVLVVAFVGAVTQLSVSAQLARAQAPDAGSAPPDLEDAVARDLARVRAVEERMAPALQTSRRIAQELERSYRTEGADLVVSEVALTVVVETLELAPGRLRPGRSVPAENGVYFAICRRPPCAIRRQRVSRELALVARLQALELALRTLEQTSADLVVVALPKRWSATILLILTRDEVLAADTAGVVLRRLQAAARVSGPDADEAARGHLFLHGGLVPYSRTRDSLVAFPVEP